MFREKSKEERCKLQEKTHCCKQCLSCVKKGHDCPVGKCKNCGMGHKDLTKEKRLKEEEAKQKFDKLKTFLREIAQVSKENKSCRSSERCNLELERTNKFEYPDFVAFLQCGRSSEKSELVHNSSESGSDDKEAKNQILNLILKMNPLVMMKT